MILSNDSDPDPRDIADRDALIAKLREALAAERAKAAALQAVCDEVVAVYDRMNRGEFGRMEPDYRPVWGAVIALREALRAYKSAPAPGGKEQT